MDIVRVRDSCSTLFEFCGTAAGVRVVSYSNVLTLDFVASKRFYNARGFLLQYQGKKKKNSENMGEKCHEHMYCYETVNSGIISAKVDI